MPPRYGQSPWLDQYPKTRRPTYPKATVSLETPVAIVGGGLTGCVTAYALAAAGVRVALFETDRSGKPRLRRPAEGPDAQRRLPRP